MAIARLSAPIHPSFASAAKAFLKSSSTSSILDLQQSFADLIHNGTKGDRQDKFDRIEMTLWLEESASDDSEKALTVRGLCHLAGYGTDMD